MALEAVAYIGAAVIAASAAFIGVVIGKEQKTTEFRQEWINAQRDDLALMLAYALNGQGTKGTKLRASLLKFDQAYNRVRLRENPEKQEWKSVLEELAWLRSVVYAVPCKVDLTLCEKRIIKLSQDLLKIEWARVRAGETWFKAAKWVLPPVVAIVGTALAYGEGFIILR